MRHYTIEVERVDENEQSREVVILAAGPIIKSRGTVARRAVLRWYPGIVEGTAYVVHWQCWNCETIGDYFFSEGSYCRTFDEAVEKFAERVKWAADMDAKALDLVFHYPAA